MLISDVLQSKQSVPKPEISFMTVIEQLQADKLNLKTELDTMTNRAMRAVELQKQAHAEVLRLNSAIETAEMDKQNLQQEKQNLIAMIEYYKSVTAKTVDEFLSKLNLDLNVYKNT